MIQQVEGFIEWMLSQTGGEDALATIISEATSKLQMESLADVSRNMFSATSHRAYSMRAVIDLDDHLEKEGWYDTMKEDKESKEGGCESIYKQDALNAYNARKPL